MKAFSLLSLILPVILCACGRSASERLDIAAGVVAQRPDSAHILLDGIDYADLDTEHQRAQYILTKAWADFGTNRSLVSDTLLPEAVEYYRAQCDTISWIRANRLLISHLYSRDRQDEAFAVLDSVIAAIPDSLVDMQYEIRQLRMSQSMRSGRFAQALADADWLIYHTNFKEVRLRSSYFKAGIYFYAGRNDESIAQFEEILASDYCPEPDSPAWREVMADYAEVLDESGRSRQALAILDDMLRRNPDIPAGERVGYMVSLAKFHANNGNLATAKRYISEIDSMHIHSDDYTGLDDYMWFMKKAIAFRETGHLYGTPNNRLVENVALAQHTKRSAIAQLDAEASRKMQLTVDKQRLWIVVLAISTALLVIVAVASYLLRRRRRRLVEAEERIEALNAMLDSVRGNSAEDKSAMLKKLVLQQLGILKTFAASPTSQNQDTLRKISTIGDAGEVPEAKGGLVDWQSFYEMVDELYDGFYTKVVSRYPDTFHPKELQIIMLMRAGFSTKEIGVLTEQSSATIYTRKSTIRRKLATPPDGDFISQLIS